VRTPSAKWKLLTTGIYTAVLAVHVDGDMMMSTYMLSRWSGRLPRMSSECGERRLVLAHSYTEWCRIVMADPEVRNTRTTLLIELCQQVMRIHFSDIRRLGNGC
jgi:hypothetical protein